MLRRLAACVAVLLGSAVAQDAPRPNIVLILCDDMGFSDIGCYGGEIDTPELDRLAAEGMRFTQFYNNAKCTTTRASIVTGLWPRYPQHLRPEFPTVGEQMRSAGYRTALIGKWHLGHGPDTHPVHRGFERVYGLMDGCCNFFDPNQKDPKFKGGRVRWFTDQAERVTEFDEDFFTTEAFTDEAVRWIDGVAPGDAPFFLHVCYTAPHYPLHAEPGDIARFRGRYERLGGWEAMRKQRFDRQRAMGLATDTWSLTDSDRRSYDWAEADQDWEDLRMSVYAGMIHAMDRGIGRIMAALRRHDVADNTLVLFLSDNGGCAEEPGGRKTERLPGPKEFYTAVGPAWGWAQNAPFKRHKSWVHEGGITTPMIAHWPGVVPCGVIQRTPGHIVDFVPTFLEIAGAQPLETMAGEAAPALEGQSIASLLRGRTSGPRELYWFWAGNRAMRRGDWKVVWDNRDKAWELYDLSKDRCERRDLASRQPDRVAAMTEAWFAWTDRVGKKVRR